MQFPRAAPGSGPREATTRITSAEIANTVAHANAQKPPLRMKDGQPFTVERLTAYFQSMGAEIQP